MQPGQQYPPGYGQPAPPQNYGYPPAMVPPMPPGGYGQPQAPYMPPAAAMAPPQQPQAPAPSMPSPGSNPFVQPVTPAVEPTPRIKDLNGRLVAFKPTRFEPNAKNDLAGPNQSQTQPRVTADCYVFDGPTLVYGGSPDYEAKPTPHTRQVAAPCMFTGMWITHQEIVKALTETPIGGEQRCITGIAIGRVVRGEQGQRPYLLNAIPVESPEYQAAIGVFMGWQTGQTRPNAPQPLGPPPAAVAQPAYAPPAAPVMGQPPAGYPVPPQPPQAAAQPAAYPPYAPPTSQWAPFPAEYAALPEHDKAAIWAAASAPAANANPFAQ